MNRARFLALFRGKPVARLRIEPKGFADRRCLNPACGAYLLPGQEARRDGLCGPCAKHNIGTPAPTLHPYGAPGLPVEHPGDGPQHAA